MNLIDITPIVLAVIALIGAVITTVFIPLIKTQISGDRAAQLSDTVNVFVKAAEQLYGAGHGEAKLAYVADALERSGVSVDVTDTADAVRAMIEAAVLELGKG